MRVMVNWFRSDAILKCTCCVKRIVCPASLAAAVLALATIAVELSAQDTSVPERLTIGPTVYLKAPRPFPLDVPETAPPFELARARSLASRNWGMAHAVQCRQVMRADTSGWAPIKIGDRDGPAVLPTTFAEDTTFRSYHGGRSWAAQSMRFSIENGWWAISYDSAGYLTSCRVQARSGEYIAQERRTPAGFAFNAFPYNTNWAPSTMITGEATTEEDLLVLWTAFASMVQPQCRYMTGDPVRDPNAPAC